MKIGNESLSSEARKKLSVYNFSWEIQRLYLQKVKSRYFYKMFKRLAEIITIFWSEFETEEAP
jgi:hypothetical protein